MGGNRTIRYFAAQIKNIPNLTVKEREVLLSRLRDKTLIKIGKKYKLSEGRIRQIERLGIEKIKSKWKQLRLFRLEN